MYALWPCTSVWPLCYLNVKKRTHHMENFFSGEVSCLTSQANPLMGCTTAFCPGSRPDKDSGGFSESGEAEAGNRIDPKATHMVADEAIKMGIFAGVLCWGICGQ